MATFQLPSGSLPHKITKASSKGVKPILKKLSYSEKNSLDLDRGWDEQRNNGWGGGIYESGAAHDVGFAATEGAVFGEGGTGTGSGMHKYNHARSTSQTSTGSGSRGGFVHPFQQTPKTSASAISHANSSTSIVDNIKDQSPTITEAEDDTLDSHAPPYPASHSQSRYVSSHHQATPSAVSQSSSRGPSIASQRTASFSEANNPGAPQLRLNTNRPAPGTASHLIHGTRNLLTSRSNLQLYLGAGLDSPADPSTDTSAGHSGFVPPPPLTAATSSPMSPLRSSFEGVGFPRLRSRSDLDTADRAEKLRAARRKFDERERAKEEKYDREMVRRRERQDAKEASRIEKEAAASAAAQRRKNSLGAPTLPIASTADLQPPPSSSTRPCTSRKSSTQASVRSGSVPIATGPHHQFLSPSSSRNDVSSASFFGNGGPSRRHSVLDENSGSGEKPLGFVSRGYDSVPGQTPPAFGAGVDDVRFQQAAPRRASTAKRKTQGYWHGFILWLRMKLLRMTGR